jgi:hypothetical protein
MQPQHKFLPGLMLVADWFRRLAEEAGLPLSQYGIRGEAFTFGAPNEFNVTATLSDQAPYPTFIASDPSRQELVVALAREAIARVERGNFGDVVWHSTSMVASGFEFTSPSYMGQFVQQLGAQTRILGWRRLGRDVLIEFAEERPDDWSEGNALMAPKAVMNVHIAVSAPCSGHFSSHASHSVLEIVAAICTFALGRGVKLPLSVSHTKPERITELATKRTDAGILGLARKHVSLDIFSAIGAPGGFDHFTRMRAAFLTFDAALQQQHDSVACILYVVAAEALCAPNAPWRDAKLTKRFIEFFRELIPTELDKMIAHDNFESVLEIRRGKRSNSALRRDLLAGIYDFRSGHVHAGLRPSYRGFASGFEPWDYIRRSLFADFAEAAILGYLLSPRSSLIGHPALETTQDEQDA